MGFTHPPASHKAPIAFPYQEPAQAHAIWKNHAKLSVMATPVTHSREPDTPDDRELAGMATAGNGHAFAALYDRHEQRVYGFCMRMLGNPHDAADATQDTFVRLLARLPALEGRDLNFAAYALACARNACYDMIEGRKRVQPVGGEQDLSTEGPFNPRDGDLTRDPERSALLAATREDVRAANAALPDRQREVLALREVELLSYDEIGEIMGLNRNAVAQLVSRARIKLSDLLRGSALASVSPCSTDCERALPLLAHIQDKQGRDPDELDWARAHLAGCDTCRLRCAAMQEAGVSYRSLAPILPLAWLRHATIARAAEFVGADWSALAGSAPGTRTSEGHGATQTTGASRGQQSNLSDEELAGSYGEQASERSQQPETGSMLGARPDRRGFARWTLAAAALLTLGVLLGATVGITQDGHVSSPANTVEPVAHAASATPTATRGSHSHDTRAVSSKQQRSLGPKGPTAVGTAHATLTLPTLSRRRTRHTQTSDHRQRPAAPRPSSPVATTQPSSTTTATPNPPTATPPPTSTTPPAETTPAPAPTTTSSTETVPTPPPTTTPEEHPGALLP